jgi:signal peptidase I
MTLSEQQTDERAPVQGKQTPTGGRRHVLVEWVVIVIVALVAALLIKTFAIQAFFIPSQSMEPTLMPGDRVLVNKLAYDFHPVHTGDIIVFRRPPNDTTPGIDDLIKRVIGLPGQTVFVSNCRVFINGKELAQPYLPKGWQEPSSEYCTTWPGSSPLPDPYKVPNGYYFVMGDNRQDSYDSRYWGPLPASYIVGRAFVRMWPPSRLGFL